MGTFAAKLNPVQKNTVSGIDKTTPVIWWKRVQVGSGAKVGSSTYCFRGVNLLSFSD